MKSLPPEVDLAHSKAALALSRAHAPYSGLHVACAIKFKDSEDLFLGVNVENASYGATICAERSAMVSAISQQGTKPVEFLVVISSFQGGPITPCGMCLQVLKEFVSEDTPIYLGDPNAIQKMHSFVEFLPKAFSPEMLPDKAK